MRDFNLRCNYDFTFYRCQNSITTVFLWHSTIANFHLWRRSVLLKRPCCLIFQVWLQLFSHRSPLYRLRVVTFYRRSRVSIILIFVLQMQFVSFDSLALLLYFQNLNSISLLSLPLIADFPLQRLQVLGYTRILISSVDSVPFNNLVSFIVSFLSFASIIPSYHRLRV